jgi:glycosyltransferase involved in cell wall biosynthesis
MVIVYVHSETFPSDSAGTVFAMNTAAAIAGLAGECFLLVPTGDKAAIPRFIEEHPVLTTDGLRLETLYGLDRRAGKIRFSWRGIFYRNVIGRLRTLVKEGAAPVVVTRDMRFAEEYFALPDMPPLVYEAHNFYGDIEGKWPEGLLVEKSKIERERKLAEIEKRIVGRCAGIVFLTDAMRSVFADFYGYRGPGAVAPSGHWIPDELPAPDREARTVAYVGPLHEHKGVGLLLEAMTKLPRDVRLLVIGGDTYLDETRRRAADLGLADRATFTGSVPPAEVSGRLAAASVGVVPLRDCFYNRYLTSPMEAFDYIAAGLPIVAPRLETLTDVFVEGKGAVLYEPDNVADLAGKIAALLDDPGLYERTVLALPELLARYTWTARAEKITALADRILGA